MRQSHTAIPERNVEWKGDFSVEPYEVAWATEAIYFARVLDAQGLSPDAPVKARVQISPDGMHWCDEGSELAILPESQVSFCRVRHFGGWLRLVGSVPHGGSLRVIIYLVLKE